MKKNLIVLLIPMILASQILPAPPMQVIDLTPTPRQPTNLERTLESFMRQQVVNQEREYERLRQEELQNKFSNGFGR